MKHPAQPRLFPTRHEREFASLRDLSARVGRDPLLVQAKNPTRNSDVGGTRSAVGGRDPYAVEESQWGWAEVSRRRITSDSR